MLGYINNPNAIPEAFGDEKSPIFEATTTTTPNKCNTTTTVVGSVQYHLYTIWLFTFSDLKTVIVPKTTFGIMNALAAPIHGIEPAGSLNPYAYGLAFFWVYINILPLLINNQRRDESLAEDAQNKPWRPLPSKRLTQKEAVTLIITLYPIALVLSLAMGGHRQAFALFLLGVWYNDFGGARGPLKRNFINASAYVCLASGAMEVALSRSQPLSLEHSSWFVVIWLVVFTTGHTQDMSDQAGDVLAGRRTLPIALGDTKTRYLTLGFMCSWAVACPVYWNAPISFFALLSCLGVLVGFRSVTKRTVEDDKTTFRLWNLWMVLLYASPLVTHLSRLSHNVYSV
ncbi:hypothetical protein P154DRAFT_547785 [Amniculicola lignicola CBS 123094]|uniref:UbiA prenyltransferase n=1 Tax=Amniculicola lignicola CBS 123094 TaxID=1392246 RepID=A0A6A5W4N1_9PLEO|nr:hypothetical protein P154DRAFT_547785 [Amniculicola lignicola CBS 123094]